jgi:hypothetical protein
VSQVLYVHLVKLVLHLALLRIVREGSAAAAEP